MALLNDVSVFMNRNHVGGKVIMWNKFSYRFKITFIFTIALIVLTLSLTALSTLNARQNISTPLARVFVSYSENIIHELYLTEEQITNLNPDEVLIIEETGTYIGGYLQEELNIAGQNFRQHSFWIAGVVIVIGAFGVFLMAGVIVKPIKKLSTSVERIEADNLSVQLPIPKSRDEISQLTTSFNEMLNKLNRSFESKQLFAQNASHELKTPLAIIRSHIEALEMDNESTI